MTSIRKNKSDISSKASYSFILALESEVTFDDMETLWIKESSYIQKRKQLAFVDIFIWTAQGRAQPREENLQWFYYEGIYRKRKP